MIIRDLFLSDVTRDIPPVVYFHEQTPEKLASEVAEYIITGGWPADHPNHRRVQSGIHEQYVKLLRCDHGRAGEAGRPRAAQRLDLGVLRLGQVELREALRAGSRWRRAARQDLARGNAHPPRHDSARAGIPQGLE